MNNRNVSDILQAPAEAIAAWEKVNLRGYRHTKLSEIIEENVGLSGVRFWGTYFRESAVQILATVFFAILFILVSYYSSKSTTAFLFGWLPLALIGAALCLLVLSFNFTYEEIKQRKSENNARLESFERDFKSVSYIFGTESPLPIGHKTKHLQQLALDLVTLEKKREGDRLKPGSVSMQELVKTYSSEVVAREALNQYMRKLVVFGDYYGVVDTQAIIHWAEAEWAKKQKPKTLPE